jgi:hypothetical protein
MIITTTDCDVPTLMSNLKGSLVCSIHFTSPALDSAMDRSCYRGHLWLSGKLEGWFVVDYRLRPGCRVGTRKQRLGDAAAKQLHLDE